MTHSFRIPPEIIDEIKQRADIVEVVSDWVQLNKRGKDYQGLCPFHQEKTPSFTVSPSKQMYYCFGCTAGGNAIKFLMEISKKSFTDVVLDLAERYHVPIPSSAFKPVDSNSHKTVVKNTSLTSPQPVPALLPENLPLQLVKLNAPPTPLPTRKYIEQGKEITETCYPYQVDQQGEVILWVMRKQWLDPSHHKGRDKIVLPYHKNELSQSVCGKGDFSWSIYRMAEAMAAIEKIKAKGGFPLLLVVEGENKVEELRCLGFAAITIQGGSWTEAVMLELAQNAVKHQFGIAKLPDHDTVGYQKAQKLAAACDRTGAVFLQLNPIDIYSELPVGGDICDIVAAGITSDVIAERLINVAIPHALTRRTNEVANAFAHNQKLLNREKNQTEYETGEHNQGIGIPLLPAPCPLSSDSGTVTGDTINVSDTSNQEELNISATVTAVTAVLEKGLPQWLEQAELDTIASRSVMSKQSFNQLVAEKRSHFDEVLPEDKKKVNQLIDWSNSTLDYHKVFPHIAADLLHDASILNIDPIMLVQYLLPAILSLYGKRGNIDLGSHKIPAILWTCIVGESGVGKSRAENLVLNWFKEKQAAEKTRFDEESAQYKDAQKKKKSSENSDAEPIEPPVPECKYMFKVATIQAVMKRLSEQGNNGSIWARDELAGLFKSLEQFSKNGEGEALECLLEHWDGLLTQVDRVSQEDSYITKASRLSLVGGIQPLVYRKIFKDPDDAQGLQARMLYALSQVQPAKRVKGFCYLAEKLPHIYRWIENLPSGDIKLSPVAEARYDGIYESIGNLAEKGETAAIRFWMRKLSTQVLRVAFALHILECFYEPERLFHEVQVDTLNRAVELIRLYRSTFNLIQESVCDRDSTTGMMARIYDLAVKSPGGLLVRDAYRNVKAIPRRAKELSRDVSAYTLSLFYQMQEMGKAVVQQNKRSFRLVVNPAAPPPNSSQDQTPPDDPPPSDPDGNGGEGMRAQPVGIVIEDAVASGVETRRVEGANVSMETIKHGDTEKLSKIFPDNPYPRNPVFSAFPLSPQQESTTYNHTQLKLSVRPFSIPVFATSTTNLISTFTSSRNKGVTMVTNPETQLHAGTQVSLTQLVSPVTIDSNLLEHNTNESQFDEKQLYEHSSVDRGNEQLENVSLKQQESSQVADNSNHHFTQNLDISKASSPCPLPFVSSADPSVNVELKHVDVLVANPTMVPSTEAVDSSVQLIGENLIAEEPSQQEFAPDATTDTFTSLTDLFPLDAVVRKTFGDGTTIIGKVFGYFNQYVQFLTDLGDVDFGHIRNLEIVST
ncbi:MAG TPA: CHC2 zinc finger domain-containing protein [Oculatellaceae cyanobacterium]|jgi:hypothetical protein